LYGPAFTIPVSGKSSGGGSGGSGGGGGGGSGGGGGTTVKSPVISPNTATVVLGATQQFSASGATSWTALSGTVTSAGLYTAPSVMTASGSDTVTATNSAGSSSATVSLLTNVPPTVT